MRICAGLRRSYTYIIEPVLLFYFKCDDLNASRAWLFGCSYCYTGVCLDPVVWMPSTLGLVLLVWCGLAGWTLASEFPERECCDPVYPPPIPTVPSSSVATPTGRSGETIAPRPNQLYATHVHMYLYSRCLNFATPYRIVAGKLSSKSCSKKMVTFMINKSYLNTSFI